MTDDNEQTEWLATARAGRADRRLAIPIVLLLAAVFAIIVPFAKHQLGSIPALILSHLTAVAIIDLLTAGLLLAQFNITRSRALLVLGCSYLFTACMIIPFALSVPGVFSEAGVLPGSGPQTTGWLYMFWHAGFPLVVIVFALVKDDDRAQLEIEESKNSSGPAILCGVGIVLLAVAALALLATIGSALLPPIFQNQVYTSEKNIIVAALWMICATALLVLWRRRPHSVLDLWLMVVLFAWLCEVALTAVFSGQRYDVGFYAGRLFGLSAATIVLMIMQVETVKMYARLTHLLAAEQENLRHEAALRRRLSDTSFIEQLAANEAVKQALIRQRAVFNSALIGIITLNEVGSIETLNPAAGTMFGVEIADVALFNIGKFIDLGGLGEIGMAVLLPAMVAEKPGVRERVAYRSDGTAFPVDFELIDMQTERRMFVVFVRDITGRKRNERLKDEFVATVSHELRTPIASIMGSLGLLAGGAAGELAVSARRMITIAHGNCQRLVRLVNDILDIEKLESGEVQFTVQPVELRALAQQAIDDNTGFANGYDVAVRLDPASIKVVVGADSDLILQVISNLLANAVKFSPSGGEVFVKVETLGTMGRLSVCDQGPGVPDDYKTRIFEKFIQIDAADDRKKGGTGLGLSIVKQIMRRLGGEVGLKSLPVRGCIFYFLLPRWGQIGEPDTEVLGYDATSLSSCPVPRA
jgi:PAS domain S-box-containing protein